MEKLLKAGNKKIARTTLYWSITPVISCPNCGACKQHCYALFPYCFYPAVKKSWDLNFSLAKTGDFVHQVEYQLTKSKTCQSVRVHVAGDFFSTDYINAWAGIIKNFPSIKFYGYSKVFELLPVDSLNRLKNCNIINSIAPDGGVNFGNAERVKYLESVGFKLCPATAGKNVNCGSTCKICLTNKKVCFNINR